MAGNFTGGCPTELPVNRRARFTSTSCFPDTKRTALQGLIGRVDLFQDELVRTRKALQSELNGEPARSEALFLQKELTDDSRHIRLLPPKQTRKSATPSTERVRRRRSRRQEQTTVEAEGFKTTPDDDSIVATKYFLL